MTINIKICTANSAFEDYGEVTRILTGIAKEIEECVGAEKDAEGYLRDVNGNTVGEWIVSK